MLEEPVEVGLKALKLGYNRPFVSSDSWLSEMTPLAAPVCQQIPAG